MCLSHILEKVSTHFNACANMSIELSLHLLNFTKREEWFLHTFTIHSSTKEALVHALIWMVDHTSDRVLPALNLGIWWCTYTTRHAPNEKSH
jgi:hypothetical protein